MIKLFQTLINIFKEIQNTNLTALLISSITIVGLVLNNEFLKVIFNRSNFFVGRSINNNSIVILAMGKQKMQYSNSN